MKSMNLFQKMKYGGNRLQKLRDLEAFLLILAAVFCIFRFVIGVSWVSGDSMFPTLRSGSPVLYYRLVQSYERGDVVSAKMPGGSYYVKRIVALEGDTVDIREGRLYVNGNPEELHGETLPQSDGVSYPLTLEAGQIFVLGDNRAVSVDSRTFGPLSDTQVRGKLLFPSVS